MKKIKGANLYSGILAVSLAILMFAEAPKIKNTQKLLVSSSLFPRITGVLALCIAIPLIVMGIMEIVQNRKHTEDETLLEQKVFSLVFIRSLIKPFLCLALIVLFIFSLGYIGTIAAGTIYLFLSFLLLTPKSNRNWPALFILSVTLPVTIYLLFTKAFGMALPFGRWMTRLFY